MSETTVRVTKPTRDKINSQATMHGESAEGYLSRLVDEDIWRSRMRRVKTAMNELDSEYVAETREWDEISETDVRDQ